MTPQPGKQTVAIHTLPNISRDKGNQTIAWETFFLEKPYEKCGGKTNPSDTPNDAQAWKSDSSSCPIITENQFQAYSKKLIGH